MNKKTWSNEELMGYLDGCVIKFGTLATNLQERIAETDNVKLKAHLSACYETLLYMLEAFLPYAVERDTLNKKFFETQRNNIEMLAKVIHEEKPCKVKESKK